MLDLLPVGHGVESWSPTGELSWATVSGQDLIVAVQRNHGEMGRRRDSGLGPVLDRRLLRLLLAIPQGVPMPGDLFSATERRLLRGQPSSIVHWHGSAVTVLLRPVVSVLSVGVVAPRWSLGLRRTSPFASYCARYVVLDTRRRIVDTSWEQAQARFYGVGLAIHAPGALEWAVAPARFRAERFTASSWLMSERIAAAIGM